jgi:hypothetical protein
MAGQEFEVVAASGLLKEVEEIVVGAYLAANRSSSRPDAYRWLRYEDPEPVARLAEGVRKLRKTGARFGSLAVDKACAEAAKLGYLN